MEQFVLQFGPERRVVTVSELNAAIRGLLDREFFDIWVSGEISGTKLASSGHYYFTLKDAESQLRCVCFRATARFLKVKPQDGIAVLARGRIDVYEARGEYQLQVEALEVQADNGPDGGPFIIGPGATESIEYAGGSHAGSYSATNVSIYSCCYEVFEKQYVVARIP